MSIFICEKCGKLDNTACSNNYWHAASNRYMKAKGSPIKIYYKPEFEYFEEHVCCSECCEGVEYKDNSGILHKTALDDDELQHWTEIGKETLLEWESRKDGSMVNATEYFKSIGEL